MKAAITLLAASICCATTLTASAADEAGARVGEVQPAPLRDLAKRAGLLVGTAVDVDALTADTPYRERIATEFSSITAENVMKWQLVESERGRLDFSAADRLVDAAQRDRQGVRGHTLVWHNAKLYLNDFNVETGNAKSDAYLRLARDLLRQHVPVDGFGAQGHLAEQFGLPSAGEIAANLKRFESLGLETSITEADVRMILPADPVKLAAQAQGYSVLLGGCLLARRCTSFTVWGFTDKYSWVPGFFPGEGAATLLDENLAAKPAYREVQADLTLAG